MRIANIDYKFAISILHLFSLLYSEKSIEVNLLSTYIKVDGIIGESEWIDAVSVEDFIEIMPGDNLPSLTKTKVLITYDKKYLYIAFHALDDPKKVRANQSKRDDIEDDDRVGVIVDPRNDGIVAYTFYSNAYGNQQDGQKYGFRERDGWDAVWLSSGRITDYGYEVEMAIPFSIFSNMSDTDFDWKISFFRIVPRPDSKRINSWTPINRDNQCEICQLGNLHGIKGIATKAPVELLPSVIGSYENKYLSDIGIGLSLPFGKTATAEITFNPDFSQVESNSARIDVNSQTALSYRETRPFFNEGIDLFNMGSGWKPKIDAVYTRSINQPIVASKILGQYKKMQYGYLGSIDQNSILIIPFSDFGGTTNNLGESRTNIFRTKYSIEKGSYIGSIISSRKYKNGSGTLGGIDGTYRFNNNMKLDWQLFFSKTKEPNDSTLSSSINGDFFGKNGFSSDFDGESFSGHGLYFSLESDKRNNSMTLLYAERSSTFRSDNGYIDFNDKRHLTITNGINFYPKTGLFENINFWLGLGRVLLYDWSIYQDWLYIGHNSQMKGQFSYDFTFLLENEFYKGIQFYNNYRIMFEIEKDFSENISIEFEPQFGTEIIREENPYQARNISFGGEISFRLVDGVKFNFKLDQSRSTDFNTGKQIYSDKIARLRFEYQPNSFLSIRIVTQYHEYYNIVDVQPLLSYQPGPFTIFYIGTSRSYDIDSQWTEDYGQIYIKAQKLFSI